MSNVDKKSIIIWSLETITNFAIIIFVTSIIFYFFHDYLFIKKAVILAYILSSLYFLSDIIMNPLYYRNFQYYINEDFLYIKKGGLSISETTIPLNRIQHVDISQSFYSRLFDQYAINIYTAGDSHSIAYLRKSEAEALKEKMVEYVKNIGVDIDG